jgi:DNA polymerase-3 subunit beta
MMFRVKKFTLQYLLEKAGMVIPTKDTMPVLKNFLIEAKDDELHVVATDMELYVVATTDMVQINTEGTAVFPAYKLLSIVKEAADGELVVRVVDGEAELHVGRASWNLKLVDGSTYPDLPNVVSDKVSKVNRVKFVKGLKSVRHAAASDTYKANLRMIDISNGQMRASDGVRYQQVPMPDCPDLQIPINAVDDLIKILSASQASEFWVHEEDDCLIFNVSGDSFIAQKLNAEFPDMDESVLKPALANEDELVLTRDDLVSAIKRVRITANPETAAVALQLEPNKLVISSRDKEGSTASESIDVSWSASDRKLAFNHQQLLQMLAMGDVQTCHFWLGVDQKKTRPSPILMKDEESGLLGVLNQVRADWLD